MAVTIRDVAAKAGVSLGTVSRFLNGYSLRKHNHQRIQQAIDELDFKQNFIAKGLKNNRTMTIGVVIVSLTDIFATSIITAAEKIVEKENYSLIVCNYEGQFEKQEQKLRFLKDRSIDGLIFYPFGQHLDILDEYKKANIPVVLVNEDIPGFETDVIVVDNSNASFRAIEKFIHLNHRKIAIICGSKDDYVNKERMKGYLEAMQVYNIPVEDRFIKFGNHSSVGGYNSAYELLTDEDPPTALFVTSYHMTIGAVMVINELNINVPNMLSVIGFDRFELSDVIKPALTVIEQPTVRMGELAAEIILRRMKGDYSDFPKKHLLNTKMLMTDSIKQL